jgi:tetratricopeptide (TPR) repeat protein
MKRRSIFILSTLLFLLSVHILWAQSENDFLLKIEKAETENDTLNLSRSLYKYGIYLSEKGEKNKARSVLIRSLDYCKDLEYDKAILIVSNYLATEYSEAGRTDSALILFHEALESAVHINDSTRMEAILLNLGDEHKDAGHFETAVDYILKAIRIKEQRGAVHNLAFYYQKLGELFKTTGDIDKWEEYVQFSYKLMKNDIDIPIETKAAVYNDLGG